MSEGALPRCAILCAGGTGGHLFPAHALSSELERRKYKVHLISDERVAPYLAQFPCSMHHIIKAATPRGRNPVAVMRALMTLARGYMAARQLIKGLSPDVVIGFGGYPTVPPLLAATSQNVPTLIHEANAVLGRANRFLSGRVSGIALGLSLFEEAPKGAVYTGNPVRDAIVNAAKLPYIASNEQAPFHLVVVGGSQGAQIFSTIVLKAIEKLPRGLKQRLRVVQQARQEDQAALISGYEAIGVNATIAPFFDRLVDHLAASHLVISRAGASTIAELAVLGRPAILVPYPHSLDHDQAANAQALVERGGAWIRLQSDFTSDWLAETLQELMRDAKRLGQAAMSAKDQGHCNAAWRLANAANVLAHRKHLTQHRVDLSEEGKVS